MPLPPSLHDKQQQNFYDESGVPIVRVANPDGSQITGGGGVSVTDDAAYTTAVNSVSPVGGVHGAGTVASGDAGVFQMTSARGLHVFVANADGTSASMGAGVQYAEGSSAGTITGNALMWETSTALNALGVVNMGQGLPVQQGTGTTWTVNATGSTVVVTPGAGSTWTVNASGSSVIVAPASSATIFTVEQKAATTFVVSGAVTISGNSTATVAPASSATIWTVEQKDAASFLINGNTTVSGAVTISGNSTAVVEPKAGSTWTVNATGSTVVVAPASSATIFTVEQKSGTTFAVSGAVTISGNSTATVAPASSATIFTVSQKNAESWLINGNTTVSGAVTISGNSTASISTASSIRAKSTAAANFLVNASGSSVVISGNSTVVVSTLPNLPVAASWFRAFSTNVTTANTTLVSSAASCAYYVKTLMVTNANTSHGTIVRLADSTANVLWVGYASTGGGGFSVNIDPPVKTAAGTALWASCDVTSASLVTIAVSGFKGS
jgi:hypothetical protein